MNMMQIMVFTQRVEFKTLLEVEFKSLTGFAPAVISCVDEFKNMLGIFESVDLLIVDEPEDMATYDQLLTQINLKQNSLKQIIALSNLPNPNPRISVFAKGDLDNMIETVRGLVTSSAVKVDGYISIPLDSLIHFKVLSFDLYIKISEEKYLKRIPAHEEIDESTFSNFVSRGVTELHFEKKYNRDFSHMLINNMINNVENDYECLDKKLKASSHVYMTTQQIVNKLGFKTRVIEVCESVMNQISEDVSSGRDNFSKYLDQLRTHKDLSYHYRLMELTSFIASQIIDSMEETGRRDKIRKVVFASMFCDYTLKNPSHLAIRSLEQYEKISPTDQKIINDHALKASELVNQYKDAPYEASMIIKQHHGSLSGVGLPDDISPKILPLSKCFMAAQEISYHILLNQLKEPVEVLGEIKSKFMNTPLEEFFEQFEHSCHENLKQAA